MQTNRILHQSMTTGKVLQTQIKPILKLISIFNGDSSHKIQFSPGLS